MDGPRTLRPGALRLTPPNIIAILLLAFALRLVWMALLPVDAVSDANAYRLYATNLADHGVFGMAPDKPSAFWAVGAPAIYAAMFKIFGTGEPAGVLLINMISSLAGTWLLWDLGRRWFGEAEGRIAALLYALWPAAIQFTTTYASELHFIALSLGAMACWDRAGFRPRGLAFLALAGLLFAGAVYVRPIALLMPAVLALAAVLRDRRAFLPAAGKAAVATLIILAAVSPWSDRNERLLGERVMISTNFWPNFWMGNRAGTTGGFAPYPSEWDAMTELERAHLTKEIVLRDLAADPFGIVPRTLRKAVMLHKRETIGVSWNRAGLEVLIGEGGVTAAKLVSTGWWYLMLLGAFGGIVVLIRRIGWLGTLICAPVWIWGYYTGVHAVIVVGDRYHMPAIPMIALLAAVALGAALRRRDAG